MSDRNGQEISITGVVTSRTCDCCGHHEIGMTTQNGEDIRLKPGMKITIIVEKYYNPYRFCLRSFRVVFSTRTVPQGQHRQYPAIRFPLQQPANT